MNNNTETRQSAIQLVREMLPNFIEIENAAILWHSENNSLAVERKAFELGAEWLANELEERLRKHRNSL